MKKKSVIVINGRHYDAHTGKPLHGPHTHGAGAAPTRPAGPRQAHTHAGRSSATYRPTRHIKPHKTEPAHTLMRKAVKKPGPSAKRHIKVQGHLGHGKERASSRIITHREPESYARHARNHAVKVTHSRLISHFSPELFSVDVHRTVATYGSGAVSRTAAHTRAHAAKPMKTRRPTADELLEYAVHHSNPPRHQVVRRKRRIIRRTPAHQHA